MIRISRTSGFTLIELLVVIAIIGILASIVLVSLTAARQKSRDANRAATMQEVQKALELYATNNNGSYPSTNGNWQSQCAGWGTYTATNVIPGLVPTYMPQPPVDVGMVAASNQNCYIYRSTGTDYKLLDYNLVSSDLKPFTALVDPSRNVGASWANNAACPGSSEATWALAAWSSAASQCW